MIWIVGFRAAGKTTVGRALAKAHSLNFLDLDEEFERRHGSILSFVEKHGIERFRALERELLAEASRLPAGTVIATGGGFVDSPESREILLASAWPKVWLAPPAELLWKRLEGDQTRIKIGSLSTEAEMRALLEKRAPFYEKIASFRLDCQDISECLALMKRFVVVGKP